MFLEQKLSVQYIRMISEGSCDASNDAENTAFHHWNTFKKYVEIEKVFFKIVIFHKINNFGSCM